MENLRLGITLISLTLFAIFLLQIVRLLIGRRSSSAARRNHVKTEHPDQVVPSPIDSLAEMGYAIRIGRDRHGRMIFKVPIGTRGFRYVYLKPPVTQEGSPTSDATGAFEAENDDTSASKPTPQRIAVG